jgi:hypothetical protein
MEYSHRVGWEVLIGDEFEPEFQEPRGSAVLALANFDEIIFANN